MVTVRMPSSCADHERIASHEGPREPVQVDLYPCCRSTVVRVEGRVITRRSHAPYVFGDGAPANRFRLRSGEPVAAVAAETGICQATLFRWKRQAFIDAGVIEGTPSVEADELAAAHKRIARWS